MKATFYGRTEGNHTGFVRIKTGHMSAKKEEIILPFDVDVSAGNSFCIQVLMSLRPIEIRQLAI